MYMTLIQCYAISLYKEFDNKIGDTSVVVHLPRELTWFPKFTWNIVVL